MVFYASLLPSVSSPSTIGRISGIGWAVGYLGSIACLVVAAFGIGDPQPATFVWVAGWFGFFSLPLFLMVRDRSPAVINKAGAWQGLKSATQAAWKTRDLRRFLIAYFIYNDAVTTTIGFAALFASDELGFPQQLLILMIIGVQVTGAIGALGFGFVADRLGTVRSILLTLVIWIVISLSSFALAVDFGFWSDDLMTLGPLGALTLRQLLFLFVGLSVGFAMGAVQSQSRTLLATMVPKHRTAEFFGLYAVCGRFSAVLGPLIFGWLSVTTGSKAMSVLALAVMFVIGAALMLGVDEDRGRRELL
jgi:UMF1 family MFS transporter